MEKRSSQRFNCDISTSVTINNQVIWCRLRDISQDGAFLTVQETHHDKVHRRILGRQVSFSVRAFPALWSTIKGEIVRVNTANDNRGFGVSFLDWHSATEL